MPATFMLLSLSFAHRIKFKATSMMVAWDNGREWPALGEGKANNKSSQGFSFFTIAMHQQF